MGRSDDAAREAAEDLGTLAGTPARAVQQGSGVRIEVDVTPVLMERWHQLVQLLATGDSFGLDDGAQGQVAWLLVRADGHAGPAAERKHNGFPLDGEGPVRRPYISRLCADGQHERCPHGITYYPEGLVGEGIEVPCTCPECSCGTEARNT